MGLTEKIQSLTTKANQKTGEQDTTLSDAVDTLIAGYDRIPAGYVKPTGTLDIGAGGEYDVTNYKNVDVHTDLTPITVTAEQGSSPTIYFPGDSDTTIMGYSYVAVNPIPSEYIIPTGTKNINITENGTTTEDITNYATAQITTNVVNQDYEDAKIAFGVMEDLANSIEALTTYTNEVTGENDTTLSDAIRTLTDGYGGGGGFEYETGTYIPATTTVPTIYFANTHSTAPCIILFADVTETSDSNNRLTSWTYVDYNAILGSGIRHTADTIHNAIFSGSRVNTSDTVTFQTSVYTQSDVTSSYFKTYMSGNNAYHSARAGRTYKWIAVWKSSQPSPTPSESDYDNVILPSEYQRVEYIESTGTQYIDIPIGFYPTDEIHALCSINQQTSGETSLIICNPYNNSDNRYALCAITGRRFQVGFGSVSTASTNTPVVNDGNMHNWEYKNRIFMSVDAMASVGVGGISFGARATGTRLFYGFYGSSSGKIRYYVHKTEDGTSVALYACYRKSDGVIGMYDVDNDIFYTNDGSGTFEKGADI